MKSSVINKKRKSSNSLNFKKNSSRVIIIVIIITVIIIIKSPLFQKRYINIIEFNDAASDIPNGQSERFSGSLSDLERYTLA